MIVLTELTLDAVDLHIWQSLHDCDNTEKKILTLDYNDYDAMVDLSVAADSGLMQRGVEGGESEAKEEQVDLCRIIIIWCKEIW